jgi:hypothetical protein
MFDGAVSGNVYVPTDLTPGRYHWRVTFAESRRRLFIKVSQLDVTAEDSRPPSAESPATGGAAMPGCHGRSRVC